MALSTPLINAAQTLIDDFGNNASLYTYTTATKTTNLEGEDTVSNWGSATTIKVVDGGSQGQQMTNAIHGKEIIGSDDKIVWNDVTVVVNDRLTYDSKNYRVDAVRSERIESVDIIQIITISEVTDVTTW